MGTGSLIFVWGVGFQVNKERWEQHTLFPAPSCFDGG